MKKLTASLCLLAVPAMLAGRAALANPPLTIPRDPKDALVGCMELRTQSPFTLPQAVATVQSCLDNVYGRQRTYALDARAGRFAVRLTPGGGGAAVAGTAMMEVEGIVITVSGTIMTGDSVVMDLDYSLSRRGGKLLGWYATVDNQAKPGL